MSKSNNLESWATATIPQLLSSDGLISDGDWIESKDQDANGSVRLIQLADVGDGNFLNKSNRFMTHDRAAALKCTYLKKGDVLVARMPEPLGRACVFPGVDMDSVTVVDICLIRASENSAIFNRLLKYWINAPQVRTEIEANSSGTTRKRITRKKLEQIVFPVPSYTEQKVIAEKLDDMLAKVERIQARLELIPQTLKQFRQSVLADAMSGKLTQEWRKKESLSATEEFIELYSHEEEYLSRKLKDDRTKKILEKVKLRQFKQASELTNLPNSWVQKPFFELCLLNRGFDLPTQNRENGIYPILSAGGEIGCHSKFMVNGPCITVGRSGSVGEVFITEKDCWPLNTALYVKDFGISDPKFIFYKLKQMNLARFASSTAVPTLNRNEFMYEAVEIPPKKEQVEIARLIDKCFCYADSIEKKLSSSLPIINQLKQSILEKAFEGELTTQWRLENPELISGENSAESLLNRIKDEKTKSDNSRKNLKMSITLPFPPLDIKLRAIVSPNKIIKVKDAFNVDSSDEDQILSGQELLLAAGYPNDADSETLEKFYLDLRASLDAGEVIKLARDDGQDWFALTKYLEKNES